MKSSNPVFSRIERDNVYADTAGATFGGITIKTGLMFLVAVLSGFFAFNLLLTNPEALVIILPVSVIVGFISSLIGIMSVRLSAPFALLYAACEGVLLGTLTTLLDSVYPGIGISAIGATIILFGVMLLLYATRVIQVTNRFRKVMFASLITMLLVVVFNLLLSLMGINLFTAVPDGLVIGITIFLIIYGALMLTLDFDRAEFIVSAGADKRMEWQVSLGLMITIVWIYVYMIRLFAMLASRKD